MIRFAENKKRPAAMRSAAQWSELAAGRSAAHRNELAAEAAGCKTPCRIFSEERCRVVRRLHRMVPSYQPTRMVSLTSLAQRIGVRAILLKDESTRFGLNAFKGLGGIYAMYRIICRECKLDPEEATLEMLLQEPYSDTIRKMVFATTTDGNHGKGVSWAAGILGCKAYVYMPAGTVEVRAQAIRDAGNAEVQITDMRYDDCVAWTAETARQNGWYLIQDTAWEGYEEVPLWIMEGYTTLYAEALSQMRELGFDKPTHIFLQTGVGSMAAAIAAAAVNAAVEPSASGSAGDCQDVSATDADSACQDMPVIATVDPDEAACFYESFLAGDGALHKASGSERTMMAGLNCSLPCKTGWEILSGCAAGGFAVSDEVTCEGMRLLAEPEGDDPKVVSGESGAVTLGLTELLLTEPMYEELRNRLKLNRDSVIFLISTEGDTDPENYQRITGTDVDHENYQRITGTGTAH